MKIICHSIQRFIPLSFSILHTIDGTMVEKIDDCYLKFVVLIQQIVPPQSTICLPHQTFEHTKEEKKNSYAVY